MLNLNKNESLLLKKIKQILIDRQLVATQTMFELFPHIPVCLELTYATNMRFMHFIPPVNDFAEMKEVASLSKRFAGRLAL